MATNVQRWTALGEALLNRPATTAQLTKLGDAIGSRNPIMNPPYSSLSNNDKAGYCLDFILNVAKGWMKEEEAKLALISAQTTAAVIDTDFAKTP